jgi:tetratricopeptide (TPR) repeat protein
MAATQAAEHARALGDEMALADAETRRARALVELGEVEAGRRAAEEALPLVHAAGHMDAISRLWNNLGQVHKVRGEFVQSQLCRERALALSQRSHVHMGSQWALAGLGELLFLRGEWDAARARLEQAAEQARARDWSLASHFRLHALAELDLAQGRWADVLRCLEEGMARAGRTQDTYYGLDLRRLLVERDLLMGDPEMARERLASLPDGAGPPRSLEEPALRALLAWALLELGEVVGAAQAVAQAIGQARAMIHRLSLVDALRVQARVAARQEHWAVAAGALEEGLSLAQGMPFPYGEARLHEAYGELHLAQGEGRRARTELKIALRLFVELGPGPHSARVERTLLGLAVPRST